MSASKKNHVSRFFHKGPESRCIRIMKDLRRIIKAKSRRSTTPHATDCPGARQGRGTINIFSCYRDIARYCSIVNGFQQMSGRGSANVEHRCIQERLEQSLSKDFGARSVGRTVEEDPNASRVTSRSAGEMVPLPGLSKSRVFAPPRVFES